MIRAFACGPGGLVEASSPEADDVVWMDALEPDAAETARIEAILGLSIPTAEDMREIEASSRLYSRDGALFMTAMLSRRGEGGEVTLAPASFVLTDGRLLTLRHHAPRAFETTPTRVQKLRLPCNGGAEVALALLEAIVDHEADTVEDIDRRIEALNTAVLGAGGEASDDRPLKEVLRAVARVDDATSKMRNSLDSLARLVSFLGSDPAAEGIGSAHSGRLRTIARDIASLLDHTGFLAAKVGFLLDATLGMINIEQNAIIKIFSVMAVVFLPPTLVASIYGMNFRYMPELSWPWGYPMAIGVMILSAVLPYWWVRRRGWL